MSHHTCLHLTLLPAVHAAWNSHCPGQTDLEYQTEFSIWVITASPLIVASDIRNMTDIMKKVSGSP